MHTKKVFRKGVLTAVYFVVAIFFVLFFLVPLWQTFVGAFSTLPDILSGEFRLYPRTFSWNYPRLMEIQIYPSVWVLFKNTVILAMAAVPCIFFSAITAFGLSRFRAPGQNIVFGMILSTLMLPFSITMIPRFTMFKTFGWINTFLPFYVPQICGSATAIFLLRQFMRNVPKELDDAAKVDGAGYWRLFWSILMPISKPALATTFIFTFIGAWNDFMTPLIFLTSNNNFPLSLGIMTLQFASNRITEWNCIMLAVLIATIPLICIFFVFQRYIIKGVVMSGLKG